VKIQEAKVKEVKAKIGTKIENKRTNCHQSSIKMLNMLSKKHFRQKKDKKVFNCHPKDPFF
jgi:hypothetical protein